MGSHRRASVEETAPEHTSEYQACARRKDTLEYHLRPYRIPMDTLREKHSAVLGMVTKLLGVTPRCDQYLELWPEGFETYNVLVPNLFDIPYCDFGMGTLNPDMRSIAAYVSSRSYGCPYCASHTAVMGTVWKGSGLTLDKNARAMDAEPDPNIFSSQELAAINIAKKVGKIPVKITAEDIQLLAREFSAKEQEAVINATSIMGFLNRFMDASGMTLEMEAIETSLSKLAPSGWTPGVAYDAETDEELMQEDRIEKDKRDARNKRTGFFGFVKMLFGAKWSDSKALRKIPSSDAGIYEKCNKVAGFVPYYLVKMQHAAAKRALAYGFLLRLNKGSEEVPTSLKQVMCYLCSRNAENAILSAHYAFLAYRNGVSIERLQQVNDDMAVGGGASAAEDAAIALAQACSWTPTRMTPTLTGLISRLFSPPAVIELLVTVSVHSSIHRWTSIYVPRSYEDGVDQFVKAHGEKLGLPAEPCTMEQSKWEDMAARSRLGVIHE